MNRKKKPIALYLVSLVIIIIGISYISVPLYQLFCQATGFGGTVQTAQMYQQGLQESKEQKMIGLTGEEPREGNPTDESGGDVLKRKLHESTKKIKGIVVYFNADTSDDLD